MKLTIAVLTGMLLAVSIGRASADDGDRDPFLVASDQAVVDVATSNVVVTVVAGDDVVVKPHPRASLIVYKPDGTMLKLRRKRLRDAQTTFRVPLGQVRQPGTYLVFATLEVDWEAFGMPTSFEVPAD